jgi:hypothetical protein
MFRHRTGKWGQSIRRIMTFHHGEHNEHIYSNALLKLELPLISGDNGHQAKSHIASHPQACGASEKDGEWYVV